MLSNILRFTDNSEKTDRQKAIIISTAALLIEAANADDNLSEDEKTRIKNILQNQFDLNKNELEEIIALANKKIEQSISFYEFTNILNTNFTRDEKYEVILRIWEIILSDSKLDSNEEYFIRTISRNLHLDHKDFIAAKMEVKAKLGLN